MGRGIILFVLASLILLSVQPAEAQQPAAKTARIGIVSSTGDARAPGPLVEAFRGKLRDLGYVEGKNIVIEYRYAEGKLDRVPGLVDELVRLKVDALVVSSVPAIRAAKRATTTVPVVMVASVDPITTGIISSMARPGGNITGVTSLTRDLRKQTLELIKQTLPEISRVGILWNVTGRLSATAYREYEAAAGARKIQLQSLEVRGPTPDLEGAFKAAIKGRAGAIVIVGDAIFARAPTGTAELAIKNRMPSISERGEYAEAGGLMDYSADYAENFRRVAVYVDKILKGAKPADLPLEQSKFNLDINLKTAKQIGLAVPAAVVARANRVIK